MYCQHFGFERPPFKITPDPELFFPGGNRGAVLDALVYAVSRGEGIVKVVGEVGSGKTMLCRMLEQELPGEAEIIYLANPNLGPDEILAAIAYELKLTLPANATKPIVMHCLHDYLVKKHADNRRVVMFVEEAQGMPLATLEELRLLSNLETAQDKLLQIVLFGQPELDDKLAAHEIRQLNERITYRFNLQPFSTSDVRDYLQRRAQVSGYRGPELFDAGAVRALTRHARGLLRRINVLADKALLAAYSSGMRRVNARHVKLAARDSEYAPPASVRWPRRGGLVGVLTGVLILILTWQLLPLNLLPLQWRPWAAPTAENTIVPPTLAPQDFVAIVRSDPVVTESPEFEDTAQLHLAFAELDRLAGNDAPVLSFEGGARVTP